MARTTPRPVEFHFLLQRLFFVTFESIQIFYVSMGQFYLFLSARNFSDHEINSKSYRIHFDKTKLKFIKKSLKVKLKKQKLTQKKRLAHINLRYMLLFQYLSGLGVILLDAFEYIVLADLNIDRKTILSKLYSVFLSLMFIRFSGS